MVDKTLTWDVSVVRRKFLDTAIEQLDEETDDWNKRIVVHFIGEEGVDTGGPYREFVSLLNRYTPMFENKTFALNSTLLQENIYQAKQICTR